MFRTSVSESSNLRRGLHRISEYTAPDKVFVDYNSATGTERGDPSKAAEKIIDFVTDPARAMPLRLPLGEDAFENLKALYLERLADMEKYKAWSVGTDFEDL